MQDSKVILLTGLTRADHVIIPCFGQVLTLFRKEASKIVYPFQESKVKKTYPVQQSVLV